MKIIFYIRTNTGCPVFLTACCYLVIGNPAVIIMRLKYNVHSLKYSEIACMFHISERAVKKRIAVAKKRVRTMFQKEDFL